jgi:ABC-type multidrug transport system fused ATPase/permease subunit
MAVSIAMKNALFQTSGLLQWQLSLTLHLLFLSRRYRETKAAAVDLSNLFAVLRRQPKIADTPDATPLVGSGGEVRFENVYFAYPDASDESLTLPFMRKTAKPPAATDDEELDKRQRYSVRNFSLTIPAGSTCAIVGRSGSGKSSVTRLLTRTYDVSRGKIFIDGQDITKCTLSSLRNAVGVIPQEMSMFNDSVLYNIRYGKPDATFEDVVEAAKLAKIHDTIMRMPNTYNTVIGERGVRLSGGEKQRLCCKSSSLIQKSHRFGNYV